jgi:hypothetical protein
MSRNSYDPDLKKYYKLYCKILTNVIKEAKRSHYDGKIKKSNNKNKTLWDIIKLETGKKHTSNEMNMLNIKGRLSNNHQDIAEAFNKHFISIPDEINTNNNSNKERNVNTAKLLLTRSFKNPFPTLKPSPVSTKQIKNIIRSIKTKNYHGYDKFPAKILKISASYISSPLTHICNKSLSLGYFPDRLKYSNVKPLHKKGDKQNMSNYRPIFLLTSFSKVLEKVKYNKLLQHLNNNKILVDEQFGFRTNSTTHRAIYKLTNEILKALNNKSTIGGIFCDLKKAFGCVDHEILLPNCLLG